MLDEYGQVVGVVTAKIDTVRGYQRTGKDIQKVGFAVATDPVLEFLKQSGVEPSPAEASPIPGIGEELLGKSQAVYGTRGLLAADGLIAPRTTDRFWPLPPDAVEPQISRYPPPAVMQGAISAGRR